MVLGVLVHTKGPDNLQADDAFELVSFEADLRLSILSRGRVQQSPEKQTRICLYSPEMFRGY